MNFVQSPASFYVADWLIEPSSNSITRGSESKRVEPKAMQVLVLLADRANQVVSRRELEDEIWTDVVVGPDSLTNTVIKLRRALGDSARNPTIIETIPKTGYRLIAPVRAVETGESEPALQRRLSAILYADVAEYSRLTGEAEERTHRILSASLDFFTDVIRRHNGTVVHYAGDAILAEFSTVTEALSCAVEVQRELHDNDAGRGEGLSVRFRIGINLGEVIVDRDDIYGDGVNVAARLEGLAEAGGICISESVYSAIGNKLPMDYEFLGEKTVKNIADPVRAYRVLFYPGSQTASRKPRPAPRFVLPFAVLAVLIVGFAFLWSHYFRIEPVADVPDKPTIAVLPFANVSVDVENELLAAGLTHDIITDLTRVSGVDVIAYSSIQDYQGRQIDADKICVDFGAQHIVEGSIGKFGQQVRINVQLVDCATRRYRWSQRYEGDFTDFFALQSQVASRVVAEISVNLTASEAVQIERLPTSNLKAYAYYQRAQQAGFNTNTADFLETIEWYEKAIEIDPAFAEAHAGLARAAVAAWRTDMSDIMAGVQAHTLAYESASRALEIDPTNAQAYSVLAVMQLADRQHQAAIESARKAVELAPGSAEAHLDLGLVLAFSGESKQGAAEIETALHLNPSSPDTLLYAGIVLFIDGQYKRAVEMLTGAMNDRRKAEQLWAYLTAAYSLLGQTDKAAETVTRLPEIHPVMSTRYYQARDAYYRRPEDLDRLLRGLRLAGMPEWPFDFRTDRYERVGAVRLRELVVNRAWEGRHKNGVVFFQEIDESGTLFYRSQNSLQIGTAKLDGDLLCHRFENTLLNQDSCGYVYLNPEGSLQDRNEFIAVLPDSLRYFSVTR